MVFAEFMLKINTIVSNIWIILKYMCNLGPRYFFLDLLYKMGYIGSWKDWTTLEPQILRFQTVNCISLWSNIPFNLWVLDSNGILFFNHNAVVLYSWLIWHQGIFNMTQIWFKVMLHKLGWLITFYPKVKFCFY